MKEGKIILIGGGVNSGKTQLIKRILEQDKFIVSADLKEMRSKRMPMLFKDEFPHVPHLVIPRESKPHWDIKYSPWLVSPWVGVDIQKEVTIMKHSACGATRCITQTEININLEQDMEKLKSKYPDWR